MVHVPLLEWIWLVPFSLPLLWTIIGIVSLLVALVAQHLANVLHKVVIIAVLAIVASMVVTIICSIIVAPTTVMTMAIPSMVLMSIPIAVAVSIASMVVSIVFNPTIGCMGLLMWCRVAVALPLAVLNLILFILQNSCLINQCLEGRSMNHRQLADKVITQTIKESLPALSISVNILRRIAGKISKLLNILRHSAVILA